MTNSIFPDSIATVPSWQVQSELWACQEEFKIRLIGLSKSCWTKDIYQALKLYGNITRIEIQKRSSENQAWVTFQPPPSTSMPFRIPDVKGSAVRWEQHRTLARSISSYSHHNRTHYGQIVLSADSITFGVRSSEHSMVAMRTVGDPEAVQLILDLERKVLDIKFNFHLGGRSRLFMFRIPIARLSCIHRLAEVDNQTDLILPYDTPPHCFLQREEGEMLSNGKIHESFSSTDEYWNDWRSWFRITTLSDGDQDENTQPITRHEDDVPIDIGRWTCYKLCFRTEYTSTPQFINFTAALIDHDIDIRTNSEYTVEDKTTLPLNRLFLHPLLSSSLKVSHSEDLFASQIHFSFPVRYQFEACLSSGYLRENNITAEFCEKLATLDTHDAVDLLEKVYDQQQTFFDPMEIFRFQRNRRARKRIPEYCVLQRSIVITPTMIYVASPQVEVSNRITRKHAADADRFIRVKFADEKNEGPLRNMPNNRAEALFNRVRRALKYGVVVAGRTYYFLAFGNSQLREHGAYFYAPTATKSAQGIRNSLGQFDHIKTVAKFGARLGQCFSTTRAVGIKAKVVSIPDIERNGYCFTDGVGRISLFLAQMAAQELGLPDPFNNPPSLYQFRLGGCKGVLVLDPSLSNTEAHIRPSQQKFEAESTRLEIIRSSAFAIPFLNRQIIVVLSALGVPNEVFLRKQESMLDDFEIAMTDETVAIAKLRTQVDMNQTTLAMADMVADGFMQHGEPFLMSLLMLWRAIGLKSLKERARIVIEKGAFVFGCVDESATLKGHNSAIQSNHNSTREEKLATLPEIFIQVDDTERKGHYKIIEGICILARNPSLHPGDVRIARAVNIPSLQHLKNVVVLPQMGDRDLANMCSGGDLDGDDYMVLWDNELLPELINELPMDFTPEKPIEKVDAITAEEIGEFLVTYMENDSLGQIAHAHLAHADLDAEGVRSKCCLELADLHSRAVDYPKSGIPARMDPGLKPSKWPHFMEKKHIHRSKIYKSRKALGLLYDQVQLVEFVPRWRNAFDDRILKAYQLDSYVLQKAKDVKLLYDEALNRIMARYGICTEFEAWSTFVLQHNNEIRDYKFAEELGRIIATLKSNFRSTCFKAAQVTDRTEWSRLGPFVAAMYTVTAREMDNFRSHEGKVPMISFPWLFASELGKIANANS